MTLARHGLGATLNGAGRFPVIERYILIARSGLEGDAEYSTIGEAREANDGEHAIGMREYEYQDTQLLETPDGGSVWPPAPAPPADDEAVTTPPAAARERVTAPAPLAATIERLRQPDGSVRIPDHRHAVAIGDMVRFTSAPEYDPRGIGRVLSEETDTDTGIRYCVVQWTGEHGREKIRADWLKQIMVREFSAAGPCLVLGKMVWRTATTISYVDSQGRTKRRGGVRVKMNLVHTEPCCGCTDHPQTNYPNGYMD